MRPGKTGLLVLTFVVGACSDGECLPEPESDPTAPLVHVVIEYTTPSGTREAIRHELGDDDRSVSADPSAGVTVSYVAADSAGLRSLTPSLTIQQTVGIGVERQTVDISPITSQCPRAQLSYQHDVPGTGEHRSVAISAVAENWTGTRSVLAPLRLRMH